MSRDPFLSLRRDYRALVPCARRRRSLVLLGSGGRGDPEHKRGPQIEAIVGPAERAALAPLIERLSGNRVHLRICEAEDGFLDTRLLWDAGERVDTGRGLR